MSSAASRWAGVSSPARPPMQMPSNGSAATNRVEAARRSGSSPPWMIPNSAWSGRSWAASERSAQRCVRSVASATTARGELGKTGWSKATAMSEPSACWTPTASSGVNRWSDPSRWLRNATPSSSTTRRSPSETTWKPPESVRIGPSQSMNRCSPPSRSMRSWPGPQVQVVGVGQDDRRAGVADVVRRQRLDRGVRADRHELRRLDHAVGQRQAPGPCPRRAVGRRVDLDRERGGAHLPVPARFEAVHHAGASSTGRSHRLAVPGSARRGGGIS